MEVATVSAAGEGPASSQQASPVMREQQVSAATDDDPVSSAVLSHTGLGVWAQ